MLRLWLRALNARRIATYPPICLGVLIATAVGYAIHDPVKLGSDFRAFYTAGTFVRRHQSLLLYDQDATLLFQRTLVPGGPPNALSAWFNPPVVAWAFVPLSALPFYVAVLVHTAGGVALGWLALHILTRELTTISRSQLVWVAAMYWPVAQWLSIGQTTGLWLLIYVAVFALLRRGGDGWAGMALGCLAWKPQLGVGLAVLLLATRRWRAAVAAIVTASLWALLSYWTLPDATRDYLGRLPRFSRYFRSDGYPTAGLHGLYQQGPLLLDGLSPLAGTVLGLFLTALAVAALFRIWWNRPWQPATAAWDLRMAASLGLAVLLSPHLYGYDRTLFLLPFAIVWHLHRAGTEGRPLDGGPLLGATALVWTLALVGPAFTVAQQWLSKVAFGGRAAVQLDVLAAVWWMLIVLRESRAVELGFGVVDASPSSESSFA